MRNADLRTLTEIARLGSFQDAANRLNMTLSAVSMQMKTLEASLQAEFFDRSVRPPRLTPLGRRAAEAAKDVLAAETMLRGLTGPKAPVAGQFRLGFVASASARLLPGFLKQVSSKLPHAQFDYRTGLSEDLESRVGSGVLDAAVVTSTGTPMGGLRHSLISRDRFALARPRQGPAKDLPFLHFAPTTGIGRLIAAEVEKHVDRTRTKTIVLDHVDTILACLEDGMGMTILPEIDLVRSRAPLAISPINCWRDLVLVTRRGTDLDDHAGLLTASLSNPTD